MQEKELGNDVTLKLVLKTEWEDNSGFQSITLFIGDKNYPDDFSDKIAQIKRPYRQYFREAEILFTCQPDYSIYQQAKNPASSGNGINMDILDVADGTSIGGGIGG